MRDRQPNKNNPYYLPNSLYRLMLATVRDYDRLCFERDNILHGGSSAGDGMPRGTDVGRPTERKAEKLEYIDRQIDAIDKALQRIPQEYRLHIFDNIRYGKTYPVDYACRKTWSRWNIRFLRGVAENLKII